MYTVKVLIQNTKTGKYLAADGSWVAAETEAADLFTMPHDHLKAIKGRGMRAVLYFPGENGEPAAIVGADALPNPLPGRCQLKPLESSDLHYLRAAQGWTELGNALEAARELERITPEQWAHPEVLKVRAKICFGMAA
jgi:hypothetical protein